MLLWDHFKEDFLVLCNRKSYKPFSEKKANFPSLKALSIFPQNLLSLVQRLEHATWEIFQLHLQNKGFYN